MFSNNNFTTSYYIILFNRYLVNNPLALWKISARSFILVLKLVMTTFLFVFFFFWGFFFFFFFFFFNIFVIYLISKFKKLKTAFFFYFSSIIFSQLDWGYRFWLYCIVNQGAGELIIGLNMCIFTGFFILVWHVLHVLLILLYSIIFLKYSSHFCMGTWQACNH